MVIIIATIWLILSVYAIYYVDYYYYWDQLFTIYLIALIIALLFNTWQLYDPELNHVIVIIETNPTWSAALYMAAVESTCITGPIAGLYILKEKIQERRG